jgi:hypothetical protein
MPVFKVDDVQNSGTVTTNLMTGSKFEFLPRNAVVSVYGAMDPVVAGVVELDFTLGNVIVGDNLPLNRTTAGEGPNRNTDLIAQGVGAGGDRIQLRTAEVGTGALNVPFRVLVQINEL